MRDFNSFKNNSENSTLNGDAMSILNKFIGKYEGASEGDVMSAIIKEAEKGRKNGTLSDADIDNFVSTISPMLNATQRAKLNAVVSKIKKT